MHDHLEVVATVVDIAPLHSLAGVVEEAEEAHHHLLTNVAENIAED